MGILSLFSQIFTRTQDAPTCTSPHFCTCTHNKKRVTGRAFSDYQKTIFPFCSLNLKMIISTGCWWLFMRLQYWLHTNSAGACRVLQLEKENEKGGETGGNCDQIEQWLNETYFKVFWALLLKEQLKILLIVDWCVHMCKSVSVLRLCVIAAVSCNVLFKIPNTLNFIPTDMLTLVKIFRKI